MNDGTRTCLGCLQLLGDRETGRHHARCLRRVLGVGSMPEVEIDPSSLYLLGLEMAGRTTLSGIQKKVSVGIERATLRAVVEDSFLILKPQSTEFPRIPENEHLSLVLSKTMGIPTAESCLVEMSDGSLALVVRRYDRAKDGRRIPMEDFCQLGGRRPAQKYEGSYEGAGRILDEFSSEPLVDKLALFERVLFSWWIGNDDLHGKNLSLITEQPSAPRLAPAYDLVNTWILGLTDHETALTIAGKRSRIRAGDWISFSESLGLQPRAILHVARRLSESRSIALSLIARCPLTQALADAYVGVVDSRHATIEELLSIGGGL